MKSTLISLLLLAGGSLFAQNYYGGYGDRYYDRYYQDRDLRNDRRDLQQDYRQLDRLRADVARDRYQVDAALARGDEHAATRIARDLARDQRALNALLADMRRDRRDIRQDQRELYGGYWGYR